MALWFPAKLAPFNLRVVRGCNFSWCQVHYPVKRVLFHLQMSLSFCVGRADRFWGKKDIQAIGANSHWILITCHTLGTQKAFPHDRPSEGGLYCFVLVCSRRQFHLPVFLYLSSYPNETGSGILCKWFTPSRNGFDIVDAFISIKCPLPNPQILMHLPSVMHFQLKLGFLYQLFCNSN